MAASKPCASYCYCLPVNGRRTAPPRIDGQSRNVKGGDCSSSALDQPFPTCHWVSGEDLNPRYSQILDTSVCVVRVDSGQPPGMRIRAVPSAYSQEQLRRYLDRIGWSGPPPSPNYACLCVDLVRSAKDALIDLATVDSRPRPDIHASTLCVYAGAVIWSKDRAHATPPVCDPLYEHVHWIRERASQDRRVSVHTG